MKQKERAAHNSQAARIGHNSCKFVVSHSHTNCFLAKSFDFKVMRPRFQHNLVAIVFLL